jgi:hypothetical protein
MGYMGTAFSNELNRDDFFKWVKWDRLFQMSGLRSWVGFAVE